MAFNTATWVRTWAIAAPSPIHDGVEGTDSGATWIVTEGCVILMCVLLFGKQLHKPISLQGDTFLRFYPVSLMYCSVMPARCASRGLWDALGLLCRACPHAASRRASRLGQ